MIKSQVIDRFVQLLVDVKQENGNVDSGTRRPYQDHPLNHSF